jgi:hypothetical protein
LFGRAFDRAERTKDAAIAGFWPKQSATIFALIKKLASVGGHGFFFLKTAVRASQYRLEDDDIFVHNKKGFDFSGSVSLCNPLN